MTNELSWRLKKFDKLAVPELYEMLKLRSEVFIVEQNCPYADCDDKDQYAYHLGGYDTDNKLVAYVRLLPPGISYAEASIGRVLTHISYRSNGTGRALMQLAIEKTLSLFTTDKIKIGAQLYLLKFYSSLGFTQTSEVYLEDDIPHIEMLLAK